MRAFAIGAAALGALTLAQAAQAGCLRDGQKIAGTLDWMSLTRPAGKPIPAPYLVLREPACIRTAAGIRRGNRIRLDMRDSYALTGLPSGVPLAVTAAYGPAKSFPRTGDIVAYRARIVDRH